MTEPARWSRRGKQSARLPSSHVQTFHLFGFLIDLLGIWGGGGALFPAEVPLPTPMGATTVLPRRENVSSKAPRRRPPVKNVSSPSHVGAAEPFN